MRKAALAQGIYFIATGLWPIMHMRSFLAVTGPKTDTWLVKTVGGLIAAVGLALLVDESKTLAIASAAALGAADAYFAGTGRISKVYLADAAVEAGLVCAWL